MLGEEHTDMLTTASFLSSPLSDQGKYAEAEPAMEREVIAE